MTLTLSCAICTPPAKLGRFDDYWAGQAVLKTHLDDHTALIPLSALVNETETRDA